MVNVSVKDYLTINARITETGLDANKEELQSAKLRYGCCLISLSFLQHLNASKFAIMKNLFMFFDMIKKIVK